MPTLPRLQANNRAMAMVRQICNIKPDDVAIARSRELLAKLELVDWKLLLRSMEMKVYNYHPGFKNGCVSNSLCYIFVENKNSNLDTLLF